METIVLIVLGMCVLWEFFTIQSLWNEKDRLWKHVTYIDSVLRANRLRVTVDSLRKVRYLSEPMGDERKLDAEGMEYGHEYSLNKYQL